MKKKIIIFIALTLLLTTITVAHAQDPIYIPIHRYGEYYVSATDEIELGTGWLACTPGLANIYKNSTNFVITLNGEFLYETTRHDPYWSPVIRTEEPIEGCLAAPSGAMGSIVRWRLPLGTLDPGTYEFTSHLSLAHKITDGYDSDGDGMIDFFEGSFGREFTIIVE